jgi:Zn-dependent protease
MTSDVLKCSNCGRKNRTPALLDNTIILRCAQCGEELGIRRPLAKIRLEVIHFALNLIALLTVPAVSFYFFNQYEVYRPLSGFIFCFSFAILSIALHEFFHAISAFFLGDELILERGYLRLSVKNYFFGLYSLALPLILLPFTGIFLPGAAIEFDYERIRSRMFRATVYAAGVTANALLLLLILAMLWAFRDLYASETESLLQYVAFLQIFLVTLNLIPIPGLDGWGIVSQILSQKVQVAANRFSFFLITAFVVGLLVYRPLNEVWMQGLTKSLLMFGLNPELVDQGQKYLVLF